MVEERVHRMMARVVALLLMSSAPFIGWGPAAWGAFGVVVGEVWLSPDLDLSPFCAAYHWWPWPVRIIWRIYSRVIPHRSPLSHWPILGTVGRLLFLFGPGVGVAMALGWDPRQVSHDTARTFAIVAGGIELSALLHAMIDYSK